MRGMVEFTRLAPEVLMRFMAYGQVGELIGRWQRP
jgi:hypothetical protein